MKDNSKRTSLWIVAAAMVGGVLAPVIRAEWMMEAPAAWGTWLRGLSLSGRGGNAVAWAAVIIVSLLPALGLLWRGRKGADWLLLLTGAELLAGQYFLVNPALLSMWGAGTYAADPATVGTALGIAYMVRTWGMAVLCCVAGTLAAWALLRLLGTLERGSGLLPKLLRVAALVYALLLGLGMVSGLMKDVSAVSAANSHTGRVVGSAVLLLWVALLKLIPSLLTCQLLLWGGELAAGLEADPFGETTVALAEAIARRCALAARLSLLLAVAANVLQLAVFSRVASVSITVYLPLLTLALAAALYLLCRYFRRAKAVSDDNATII